jgi:hypothetical protein
MNNPDEGEESAFGGSIYSEAEKFKGIFRLKKDNRTRSLVTIDKKPPE